MSHRRSRSVLQRITGLFRGALSLWVRDREQGNPRAVYQAAIDERLRQYRDLKQAVAGILYMRNRLDGEIRDRRTEVARCHEDVCRALRRGDDEAALVVIERKQSLLEDLARAEAELAEVRAEADEAKSNLTRFRDEIHALERERTRSMATLASARTRRRMRQAFEGLTFESDLRALESVRELVVRVRAEGGLERELDQGDEVRRRVGALRQEARSEAARAELSELKRTLAVRVLPAVVKRDAARAHERAAAGV